MIRLLIAYLVLSPLASQAYCQSESIPDTLDWHGYFPLEIGNKWQYYIDAYHDPFGTVDEYLLTWEIVEDSTIDLDDFFVLEVSCDSIYTWPGLGNDPCRYPTARRYIGYDETAHNIRVANATSDSTHEFEIWFAYPFDLSTPFNFVDTTDPSGSLGYYRGPEDWLLISQDTVRTTIKEIQVGSAVPGYYSFAHSIGLVYSHFSEGGGAKEELVYARVGGHSYGTFLVGNDELPMQINSFAMEVYPLPTANDFTIEFSLSKSGFTSIIVYDILGRMNQNNYLGYLASGVNVVEVASNRLPNGLYVVAIVSGGIRLGSAEILVAK